MARTTSNTLPDFKNATEKKAWLLKQLQEVESEAVWEEIAVGTNELITIRAGKAFGVTAGGFTLYEGTDAAQFVATLSTLIETLPLGSTFVVEAGRGGKVMTGGVTPEGGDAAEEAKPARRSRKPKESAR